MARPKHSSSRQDASAEGGGALRLFYAPDAAQWDGVAQHPLSLPPDEAHHALHVLRLGVGDRVRLLDGQGFFYDAEVVQTGRHEIAVRLLNRFASTSEPATRLILLIGLLKNKVAEFLIQKSVEIGVSEIVFFPAVRSVGRVESGEEAEAAERWSKIAVGAAKQCGRARLTEIAVCRSLEEALGKLPQDAARYLFWEEEARNASDGNGSGTAANDSDELAGWALQRRTAGQTVGLLIGPEGGLTREEVECGREREFQVCSLGSRILRAETAALAAASAVLYLGGDLGRIPSPGT
jgi:16S rRNA (uracil1498-N3)-methyltransferase